MRYRSWSLSSKTTGLTSPIYFLWTWIFSLASWDKMSAYTHPISTTLTPTHIKHTCKLFILNQSFSFYSFPITTNMLVKSQITPKRKIKSKRWGGLERTTKWPGLDPVVLTPSEKTCKHNLSFPFILLLLLFETLL